MRGRYRRWKGRLAIWAMGVALLVCLVPLVSLVHTLVRNGAGELSFRFVASGWRPVGEQGGIAHAIVGSVYLLVMASMLAIPLGLAQGLFLARSRSPRLSAVIRVLLDVMTGIPAIIVGVFIYTVAVRNSGLSLGVGFSAVAGALALTLIMLPIFARTTEEALRAIPTSIDEAGLALGVPRRRVVLRVVLRSAVPAVLTGLFLALARVAGEAAPLLFTAFGSNDWPGSPLRPTQSLPQLLFDCARQPFEELVREAWGAALVLVAMILAVRLATQLYLQWKYSGGTHA